MRFCQVLFAPFVQKYQKASLGGGADYTVVDRRCQVLFTAIVPNCSLASLCGVEYNYGRLWQTEAGRGKFTKIFGNLH